MGSKGTEYLNLSNERKVCKSVEIKMSEFVCSVFEMTLIMRQSGHILQV